MRLNASIARTRNRWTGPTAILAIGVLFSGCASRGPAASRSAIVSPQPPSAVVTTLVQLHGAVAEQYAQGGMELEHFLLLTQWIGDGIRIAQARPDQWEAFARTQWRQVHSLLASHDLLAPWPAKIEALIQ